MNTQDMTPVMNTGHGIQLSGFPVPPSERVMMATTARVMFLLRTPFVTSSMAGWGLLAIGFMTCAPVSGCQILDVPQGLGSDRITTPISSNPTAKAPLPSQKPLAPIQLVSNALPSPEPANQPLVIASTKPIAKEGLHSRPDLLLATRGMLAALTPIDPPLPMPAGPTETDPLMIVYRRGYNWFQGTDSFTCRMFRREVVRGKPHPEELMSFQYRKNPYSIHFKWLGQEGKGREVVYVEGKYDDKIQTKLAGGDIPFVSAGKRMSFSIDNPLVRNASRHSVREASFGFMLSTVGTMISHQKENNPKLGSIQYIGKIRRPDIEGEIELVECRLAAGAELALPEGGRRLYGFDPVLGNPVLLQTFDLKGQEVEYYRYDRFFFKGLEEDDFNPEVLWAQPNGKPKQS